MRWAKLPSVSCSKSGSQSSPQITLTTFQPAPRKIASISCIIFPLPRTGPSRTLEVAVYDPDEVVELFARREGERTQALGLVALAVAQKRPTPCCRQLA